MQVGDLERPGEMRLGWGRMEGQCRPFFARRDSEISLPCKSLRATNPAGKDFKLEIAFITVFLSVIPLVLPSLGYLRSTPARSLSVSMRDL